MNISVELCDIENKVIISNIYPFYLHDLSEIWDRKPNKYGVFEEDDKYMTLHHQIRKQDIWWEKPSVLFPYLISVNDIPAGFALVATPPHTPINVNYLLNEFFCLDLFVVRVSENLLPKKYSTNSVVPGNYIPVRI
jgi:hypothetical protein